MWLWPAGLRATQRFLSGRRWCQENVTIGCTEGAWQRNRLHEPCRQLLYWGPRKGKGSLFSSFAFCLSNLPPPGGGPAQGCSHVLIEIRERQSGEEQVDTTISFSGQVAPELQLPVPMASVLSSRFGNMQPWFIHHAQHASGIPFCTVTPRPILLGHNNGLTPLRVSIICVSIFQYYS